MCAYFFGHTTHNDLRNDVKGGSVTATLRDVTNMVLRCHGDDIDGVVLGVWNRTDIVALFFCETIGQASKK